MPPRRSLNRIFFAIAGWAGTVALTLSLTACSPSSTANSTPSPRKPATQQISAYARARARKQQIDADSQQLDTIPPPDKPRYMAVSSSAHWQNPFLTIQKNSVELRIPAPPVRQPRRSRRRIRRVAPLWKTTSLTFDALPAALAALPESNWPYGRVIAVQDDLSGPAGNRIQVRRNEEKILNLLNNLGVIAYEWPRTRTRKR